MSELEIILLIIRWLPTALFCLGLVTPILLGMARGYRKSMILFVNSLVLMIIFVVLYFILSGTNFGDSLILKAFDLILGEQGLAKILGVTKETTSFRELLVFYLSNTLTKASPIGGVAELVEGNGLYIETIVSFVYHLVFAVLFYILYFIFDFILYLFYVFFRSNVKFAQKEEKRFRDNKTFHLYHKNSLGGFFVGLFRGIIKSFVSLTFIGSLLFVLSGDIGKGTLKEREFENKDVNVLYQVYREFDNYSNHGIFKVLSTFTDNDGTPVYLQIPDFILSGKVTKNNETQEINLRSDLASYTSFAKGLVNVALNHEDQMVDKLFNGEITPNDFISDLFGKASNPSFQSDLIYMVSELPDENFAAKLAISVTDSLINYIDVTTVGVPTELAEPIYIMFKDGYLSNYIEEETLIKINNNTEGKTDIVFENITPSEIITKQDLTIILQLAFTVVPTITSGNFNMTDIEGTIFPLVLSTIDYISELSLFDESEGMNTTVGRLYNYAEAVFLNNITPSSNGDIVVPLSSSTNTLTEVEEIRMQEYINEVTNDYDWHKEMQSLFGIAKDAITLYQNFMSVESDNTVTKVLALFDKNSENFEENQRIINSIFDFLSDSALLGKVLASDLVINTVEQVVASTTGVVDYELPSDMKFYNTYDDKGNVKSYGEMYNLFGLVRLILSEQNTELFNYVYNMLSGGTVEGENPIASLVPILINTLNNKDANGKTITDYIVDSTLLRSTVSAFAIGKAGEFIYVPSSALETGTKMIKKDELKTIFDAIPALAGDAMGLIEPLLNGGDTSNLVPSLVGLLKADSVKGLLESKIVQSTIGKTIINLKAQGGALDMIVLSKRLLNPENWATNGDNKSEVLKLLNSVDLLNLDLSSLLGSSSTDNTSNVQAASYKVNAEAIETEGSTNIIGTILSGVSTLVSSGKLDEFFESEIIHYTLSYFIDTNIDTLLGENASLKIIIPVSATKGLQNDVIDRVITVEEFTKILSILSSLGITSLDELSGDNAVTTLLTGLIKNKKDALSSYILSATLVYTISNLKSGEESVLQIPLSLSPYSTVEALKTYDVFNPWYSELEHIFDIVYILFDLDNPEVTAISLDDLSNMADKAKTLLLDYDSPSGIEGYTNFELLSSSEIVLATLTGFVDQFLTTDIIDTNIRELAKHSGRYDADELKSILDLMKVNNVDINSSNPLGSIENGLTFIDNFETSDQSFYLIRGIISKKIAEQITINPLAYESNSKKVLKKTEIVTLLKIIGHEEVADSKTVIKIDLPPTISTENFTLGFIESLIGSDSICNSYIVVGLFSDEIMKKSSSLVIPSSCVKNGYITFEEIKNIITSIASLNKNNSADGTGKDIPLTNLSFNPSSNDISKELLKSQIINATFASQLKFGNNDSSEGASFKAGAEGSYGVTSATSTDSRPILLIKDGEVEALINCFQILGSNFSFSLANLNTYQANGQMTTLLKSSVIRVAISDYILENDLIKNNHALIKIATQIDIDAINKASVRYFDSPGQAEERTILNEAQISTLLSYLGGHSS